MMAKKKTTTDRCVLCGAPLVGDHLLFCPGPPKSDPTCPFCGGDSSAPDHAAHCDGRQGGRDDPPPDDPPEDDPEDEAERIRRHRETSVQSFYNSVESGIITTRRHQVWAALLLMGPATIKETDQYLRHQQHLAVTVWSVGPRFAELRDLGLIREVGKRPCRVTGSIVLIWEAVPSDQHGGLATIHRCATCHQIVSRDIGVTRVRARREGAPEPGRPPL